MSGRGGLKLSHRRTPILCNFFFAHSPSLCGPSKRLNDSRLQHSLHAFHHSSGCHNERKDSFSPSLTHHLRSLVVNGVINHGKKLFWFHDVLTVLAHLLHLYVHVELRHM